MTANALPESLGGYRLIDKLGQGGMAVVYRGERAGDAGFRKKVAIKRMLPQYRRDPSLLERFAAEARTNARLDHPNLVQVLDFGIDPEPYLVLEFVEGVTLGAIMQRLAERREKLDAAAACYIAAEVASGLDHAHRKRGEDGTPLGIVHRDVSPQNVLVSNEGAVKVSDFGLVKAADNVLKTQSGVTIGKLSYMAPEQAEGQDVDGRADIFALGVTLWEMLTIRSLIPPDDPLAAAKLLKTGEFPRPSTIHPEVPPELEAIVMGCLRIDRALRTPSAQQLAQDLREVLHARAAGYGKPQLARLVQWLFPEKGWELPEPERPAAQPSDRERASMMPVTPAAVAVARVAAEPTALIAAQPAVPASTSSHVAASAFARHTQAAAGTPARQTVVAAGAPARRTRAAALAIVIALFAAATLGLGLVFSAIAYVVRGRATAEPSAPPLEPLAPGVTFESPTPGLRLFLGARELGGVPLHLRAEELTGEPVVALAPAHQPLVLRAERMVELTRAIGRVHRLELEPSRHPDLMVYVRYDGQGTAHLLTGVGIGEVPGVVRVPIERDQPVPAAITVFDETGQSSVTLSIEDCEPSRVCLLYAGSGS